MPVIEFTDNHEGPVDRPGFQFKFRCERCGTASCRRSKDEHDRRWRGASCGGGEPPGRIFGQAASGAYEVSAPSAVPSTTRRCGRGRGGEAAVPQVRRCGTGCASRPAGTAPRRCASSAPRSPRRRSPRSDPSTCGPRSQTTSSSRRNQRMSAKGSRRRRSARPAASPPSARSSARLRRKLVAAAFCGSAGEAQPRREVLRGVRGEAGEA